MKLPFQSLRLDLTADDPTAGLAGSWEDLREGVRLFRVYGEADSGASAAFIRYAPGSKVPAHRHTGMEHVWVLSGSQRDERGTYGAGTCVVNAPGSRHAVASDDGCLVFVIWNDAIAFVE